MKSNKERDQSSDLNRAVGMMRSEKPKLFESPRSVWFMRWEMLAGWRRCTGRATWRGNRTSTTKTPDTPWLQCKVRSSDVAAGSGIRQRVTHYQRSSHAMTGLLVIP